MLSSAKAYNHSFSMALWINTPLLEGYSHDKDLQLMIDDIVWEDRIDDLIRIADFYHIDVFNMNCQDQIVLGEEFAKHIYQCKTVFEFTFDTGYGRLYFVGDRDEVFAKINRLY